MNMVADTWTIQTIIGTTGGVIGAFGGLLGIWAFIDNYLLKFKPKIYLGTKFIFNTITEHSQLKAKGIICSLEICNHRKKYGTINDFAIRVYISNAINSHSSIYYASEIISDISANIDDSFNKSSSVFNPISILPNSNKTIHLLLLPKLLGSLTIKETEKNSYCIDVYCQKKSNDKWEKINSVQVYNFDLNRKISNNYIYFDSGNYYKTRDKLNNSISRTKSLLFQGVYHKFLLRLKYKFQGYFITISSFIKNTLLIIPFYIKFLIQFVIDKFIKLPLIIKMAKKLETVRISVGNQKNMEITKTSFNKLFTEIKYIADIINKDADDQASISVQQPKNDNSIIISRYRSNMKIYISGDGYMHAQINDSRIQYDLSLKQKMFGWKYWCLDDTQYISINSFAIKLFDAFIAHSNH